MSSNEQAETNSIMDECFHTTGFNWMLIAV